LLSFAEISLIIFVYTGHVLKHTVLGDYVKEKVPSLKHFMSNEIKELEHNIPSLAALSNAMRSLERCKNSTEFSWNGFDQST
jgi:hypothetical protein